MVHCGFEGTAATDSIKRPWKLAQIALNGIRTEGPFAPDIDISRARPAQDVFSTHVERELEKIKAADPEGYKRVAYVK